MKKAVPSCLSAPPCTQRHGDRAIWASLGIKGVFVCSAFRRNPAKEQRSGEKCWYLFIQESFVNNMYLGAFRNNITRPTELLNQFGSDTPAHTRAEARAARGTPGRARGRGQLEKQPCTGVQRLTSDPGGLRAAGRSLGSPQSCF